MSAIHPAVFDFVTDAAEQIDEAGQLLTKFDDDGGLVLFCREFFQQFIAAEFEVDVRSFSPRGATNVWLKVKRQLGDEDGRVPIVAAFREFCQDYDTIVGERYDKGGQLSAFQTEFVPELLAHVEDWAHDEALIDAVSSAREALDDAVGKAQSDE